MDMTGWTYEFDHGRDSRIEQGELLVRLSFEESFPDPDVAIHVMTMSGETYFVGRWEAFPVWESEKYPRREIPPMQSSEKPQYGLKEQIQRACDIVAGDRVVGKSPYTPEQIAEIEAFNKAHPLPRPTVRQLFQKYADRCNLQDEDVEYVMELMHSEVNAALERCATLVETSHTAHDLYEIAATIRGWKQSEESSP